MAHVDYYFTVNSPWVYLAGDRLERIAAARGATIAYKPMALDQSFEATGFTPLPRRHPARVAYRAQELTRWARALDMPFVLHPRFFPADPAPASAAIAALALAGGDAGALQRAVSRAQWAEERDIADAATLAEIAAGLGVDLAALPLAAGMAAFRANGPAALARGVFGAPFYVVDDGEMFWGQDRLAMLDAHLAARAV